MRFQIAGHRADYFTSRIFRHQVPRVPAGAAANRFRQFQGMQKFVRYKWIEAISSRCVEDRWGVRGAGVPALGGDIADGRNHTEAEVVAHAEGQSSRALWPKSF